MFYIAQNLNLIHFFDPSDFLTKRLNILHPEEVRMLKNVVPFFQNYNLKGLFMIREGRTRDKTVEMGSCYVNPRK